MTRLSLFHGLALLVAYQFVLSGSRDVEIVTATTDCPSSGVCLTLVKCLLNASFCFSSDSVVTFSPGDHFTGNLSGFLVIKRRQNLTLKIAASEDSVDVAASANINCLKGIGFAFFDIRNLTITGLSFHDCGAPIPDTLRHEAIRVQTNTYYFFFERTKTALFLVNIFNMNVNYLHINNSDGYGLFVINALGISSVSNSVFTYNNYRALKYHQYNPKYCDAVHVPNITTCSGGNLVVLFQDEPQCYLPLQEYVLIITNSTFSYGVNLDHEAWDPPPYYVYNAGGLSVFTSQVTYSVLVSVDNIVASNNIGHNGANAVVYIHDLKGVDVLVSINSSIFRNGNSDLKFSSNVAYAGGIYVYYGDCACGHYKTCTRNTQQLRPDDRNFVLSNCTFTNNYGFKGAAILLTSLVDDQDLNGQDEIATFYVHNCTVMDNTGYVGIINVKETRTSTDSAYHMEFILSNTVISYNHLMRLVHTTLLSSLPERNSLSTVGVFHQLSTFKNVTISHNDLVGLHVERNEVDFHGDSFITSNNVIGGFGGGIRIYRAVIRLWSGCFLYIARNSADLGAGIYVDNISKSQQVCFFDIDAKWKLISHNRIKFWNNKAKLAGNSVYGGHIEKCTLHDGSIPGITALPILFNIPWNNSLTEITSHVHLLCFCENSLPSCDRREWQEVISPGQGIIISAVAVGQLNGTVPSVVLSEIVYPDSVATLGSQQDVQQLSTVCGDLHYQIKAFENSNIQINLQTSFDRQQRPTQALGNALNLYINVTTCPPGFVQNNEKDCDCISFLRERGVICHISDLSFELVPPMWIGYAHSSGLILAHDSCPFDYCNTSTTRIVLTSADTLCQFQRSGILCGMCKKGLSIVFGSSRCRHCSNHYAALILVFILAGFILVLALIYLDLTVADGTLNGLIFYVNIVRIHHAIIFPPGHTNVVTVFTAWLNLDLGIELCFYNGFDVYARTWLQFLFPVYIWVIILMIILFGWYSATVARIVGSNSVPVLATLLLMSYTKLQCTILESLSFTVVKSHLEHTFYVWLYDGNISYFGAKHMFLVLTACVFAIGFIIPFTVIVLCGPVLQKNCSRLMLKYKLTPINDAYQGPYKTKHRWWTGVMLLVRTILILFFTLNVLGNQRMNLLFIVTVCIVLLGLMWNVGTIYKHWCVNLIESFYIVNLALLAGWCEYNRQTSISYIRDQSIIAYMY